MFCFLFSFLNSMETLPSRTLQMKATKSWLKCYCLLEQMRIIKSRFVILMIVRWSRCYAQGRVCGIDDCYDEQYFLFFYFVR